MLKFLKKLITLKPIEEIGEVIISPFTYKKGSLVLFSIPVTWAIDFFEWYYNCSFLGISLSFISILVALIVIDFWTGLRASQQEGERVRSDKLAYTFFKFLSSFGFFLIIYEVDKIVQNGIANQNWFQFVFKQGEYMIAFVRSFVFIILVAREFISVGENIQRKFGKKPHIFLLVEKIAVQIELKFIKKIEESDLCPPKKETKDEQEN